MRQAAALWQSTGQHAWQHYEEVCKRNKEQQARAITSNIHPYKNSQRLMETNVGPLLSGVSDFLKSGQRTGWGESMPSLSQYSSAGLPGLCAPQKS